MLAVNDSKDQWTPCNQGTLEQFAARDRSRKVVRRSVLSLSVLAVLSGGFALSQMSVLSGNGPISKAYGGLSCVETQTRADAFLSNTLPKQSRREVLAHLRDCPACTKKFDEMLLGKPAQPVFFSRQSSRHDNESEADLR
jgi:Putative zinc-finger